MSDDSKMPSANPFIKKNQTHIRNPAPGECILFLDFDGVVHPTDHVINIMAHWDQMKPYIGKTLFLPEKVMLVKRLCHAINAKIVISSAWRNQDWGIDPFMEIFDQLVIGQTPELIEKLGSKGIRQREIGVYLSEMPPIEYVIIDDNAKNFILPNEHLYLTHSNIGITSELVDKIVDDIHTKNLAAE